MKRKVIFGCLSLSLASIVLIGCAVTSQFTPLPWGIKIASPPPDLPREIAAFSGIWYGIWDNGQRTTLVVQSIKPPEASVVYSWGPVGKEREGGFREYVGLIEPRKLTIKIPERETTITYLLSDDGQQLKGEFRVAKSLNYVTMWRQLP